MGQKVKRGPGGRTKVLNTPGQINPIAREPHDNTADLEQAVFKAQSRRKMPAAGDMIPGTKTTAPPSKTTSLPS